LEDQEIMMLKRGLTIIWLNAKTSLTRE